jgi:hypothetical protein
MWVGLAVTSLLVFLRALPALTSGAYHNDFTQDYLLARAAVDGLDPYLPLADLADLYLPTSQAKTGVITLPLASPHPPAVAIMFIPFTVMPLETANALWFVAQLGLLLLLCFLVFPPRPGSRMQWHAIGFFCLLLCWSPIVIELFYGQLNLLLAVLLVGSYRAANCGAPRVAGTLLGAAIAIKAFPVVVAGYYLLRREWRTASWAAGAAGVVSILPILIIGPGSIVSYGHQFLASTGYWQATEGHYSLTAAFRRLFTGTINVHPLVELPWGALVLSSLTALVILALAAQAIVRAEDSSIALSIALCAAILVSPLSWNYYLVLLIGPMLWTASRLRARGWPLWNANVWLLALALISVPVGTFMGLPALIASELPKVGLETIEPPPYGKLPGYAGLPLLLLPSGPLLLFTLLMREAAVSIRPDRMHHQAPDENTRNDRERAVLWPFKLRPR